MTITASEPDRPTAEMLRRLTDRRVFEQLLDADSLTRAEIAARTGISKPTISESVRRLTDAGWWSRADARSAVAAAPAPTADSGPTTPRPSRSRWDPTASSRTRST